nr:hypothetical protein Iba_chr10eCG12960 [Ipomoea batatas]
MEFAKDLELQSMQLFMDTQVQESGYALVGEIHYTLPSERALFRYGSIAHINLKLPPRDQDPPGYAFVEQHSRTPAPPDSRAASPSRLLHCNKCLGFMPHDRSLRLRLCLATTPSPTSHQLLGLRIHLQPA